MPSPLPSRDVDTDERDVDSAAVEPQAVEMASVDAIAFDDESEQVESQLTDRERRMIEFERQWWRHAGSKEQAIREQFDLSATRYYQMLNQLLERPEALAFDPLVVSRLRRLRATRARTRTAH